MFPVEKTNTKEKIEVAVPKRFKVIMHNDDYTSMEFVIEVLVEIFNKTVAEATEIMMEVHKKGIGVAGVFSYDIANTKVIEAMNRAEESEFPFVMTVEEE